MGIQNKTPYKAEYVPLLGNIIKLSFKKFVSGLENNTSGLVNFCTYWNGSDPRDKLKTDPDICL
jgi:hypothetical protein